jgi:DNA-binding response OmpR family regulator
VEILKVLIIEDNQDTIDNICLSLGVGYQNLSTHIAIEEPEILETVKTELPDLAILDISLSDIDVITLINRIRRVSDLPLIIIGKKEKDLFIARALDAGADEFIEIKFTPIELIARCRALLRRCHKSANDNHGSVSFNGLTVNLINHEVLLSDKPVKLTPTEFGLLSELIRNKDRVVATQDLLEKIWGTEYIGDPNLVKTYVYRLRSKLKRTDSIDINIASERGIGYRLVKTTSNKNSLR